MAVLDEAHRSLESIPNLQVNRNFVLAQVVRFAIGGPADLFVTTADAAALLQALAVVRASGLPWTLIGGGSNLVVADTGFRGIVLRFDGRRIERVDGATVRVEAGAVLQDLVDFTVNEGLQGLETLTGIPGSAGGALYGNAGAYGHSMQEVVAAVTYADQAGLHTADNTACGFAYRDSGFKRDKSRVIVSAGLRLRPGVKEELQRAAADILTTRNRKFPPDMRCAGSFFKNCMYAQLPGAAQAEVPPALVRDGKVPSAWFLEQIGAKGRRRGGIHIADYHANTPYNAGGGTAREVIELIAELKAEVRLRFGFELEEEVQYVGFDRPAAGVTGAPVAAGTPAGQH
jgi:UDP-N-acetylmuramate dehydrogenase